MGMTGPIGPLLTLAMVVVGMYGMISASRARRARRNGQAPTDTEADQRRAARAETERRMAAYLASRDAGRTGAHVEDFEQETKR